MAMGRLNGKVALITGAASGIGRTAAEMMVAEGAKVALADRNAEGAEAAAAAIGRDAIALPLDVTEFEAWAGAVDKTVTAFGRLDTLVHSAGVGHGGTIEDTSLEMWRLSHAVNLDAVFYGTKTALPVMRLYAPGSIIILSSIAGIIAGHNMAAYNSSKAGVRHLAKSIALHCARKGYNIRCNSIHPTFIDTPMVQQMLLSQGPDPAVVRQKLERQVPLGRLGEASDVGHAIVYLASEESKFMTGSELRLDGGISAM